MTKATNTDVAETRGGDHSSAASFLRGTLHGGARVVVRWILLQLIRPFIRLTIEGLEHVPERTSFLFVANHLHNADPILLEAAITRPVHFMAKKELFRSRPIAWGLRFVGAFPVDRGRPDRTAIRRATALLASGVAVGMFPEGTRSASSTLQRGFPGAGLIALQADAPILPATIVGTEALPFNGSKRNSRNDPRRPRLHRRRVRIRFGKPYQLPSKINGDRVTATQATELMMIEIARLLPEPYRGVYADLVVQPPATGSTAPLPAAGTPAAIT